MQATDIQHVWGHVDTFAKERLSRSAQDGLLLLQPPVPAAVQPVADM